MKSANGLQLIRVSADQVVLKHGVTEFLLRGEVTGLIEPVLHLVDDEHSVDEITNAFPGQARQMVNELLVALQARRMIEESPKAGALDEGNTLQWAFYDNFDPSPDNLMARLASAEVQIYGVNLISRALVRSLLEMGIGRVTLVYDSVLNNQLGPATWVEAALADSQKSGETRLCLLDGHQPAHNLEKVDLLCATCDFGRAQVMLDINRWALATGKPFLPIWLEDLIGYVGPLVYPFETACLRCFQLRVDANDLRPAISSSIRAHMTTEPSARPGAGVLPPMAGIAGEIAAMEVCKVLSRFAPADTISRLIEINLVSFQSTVRRVLKIPRCPDCGNGVDHASRVIMHGPQIPDR